MDGQTAADLQRDDQLAATPSGAIRAHIDASLRELHTCMPGIIRSFDPASQTATVQPAFKTVFVGEEPMDLPLCTDVPVVFPEGGGFVLTFPVAPGDECLLHFSERAIDFWWDRGGVQLPSEVRFHDLSDGFAQVGVRSRPRFLTGVATNAAELRTRDGGTVVRLEAGAVYVGGKTGAEAAIKGETFIADLGDFLGTLANACTGVSTLPQAATAINAIGPAASKLIGQLNAALAQKAKVL